MIGAFAAAAGLLALIDPRLRALAWAALALAALALSRERPRTYLPVLAIGLVGLSTLGFSVGADSLNYFAYASSLLSDRDLSLENQWSRLGFVTQGLTPTGLVPNAMSVGPGLVWLAPVAITHAWLGLTGGATDSLRLAESYYSAAAATTLAAVLLAVFVLARSLSPGVGGTAAWIAVLTSVLASPILYYAAVQPLMSHGLTFAAAAFTLALTLRAENSGRRALWILGGASLGLAMLCRTQAVVLTLFVLAGLWRARAGWLTALWTGVGAVAVFSPQLLVWKVLYGSFITIPQGSDFIDWTGRHTLDVLLSADRGLFNWHPALLPGLFGLLVLLRVPELRAYAVACLAILGLTAFVNGSVRDWNASAAFGARRFDLVAPPLAFGLAHLLSRSRPFLSARPLFLPAVALVMAGLWNASLIDIRKGQSQSALPLDDLVRLQVEQARRAADATVGRLGQRARAIIYQGFVGLATYENYRPGGDFDLATLEQRFLRRGWSDVQGWDDGSLFRYLLYPKACITIPIGEPFDLHGFVLARSPARIKDQRMTLILNGRSVTEAPLPANWTEVSFVAPRELWRSGENEFCIRVSKKRPGDEGDDLAFAAAVIKVQLP
ncbi:MAG: hypothetical protein JJE39_18025 [Vicinamibacteria bacterium]|nr:hypothetical protein [Vicinamibacteria bacterium]